jgi:hypothetical protein
MADVKAVGIGEREEWKSGDMPVDNKEKREKRQVEA